MSQMIDLEIQLFTDPANGLPLANGLVYVGVAGTDPTQAVNQIALTLRQENGDEVAVAQPVQLGGGGQPLYNGSPAQIMTAASDYALAVHDKNDAQVYYVGTRLINAAVAETAANVALTAADVVTTNANVVLTSADVVSTNADVVTTNADVVSTNADVVLAEAAKDDAEAAASTVDTTTTLSQSQLAVSNWKQLAAPQNGFDVNAAIEMDFTRFMFVGGALGTKAFIGITTDFETWTEPANPKNFALKDVVKIDTFDYIAVGEADGTDAYIVYSDDGGTTWSEHANPKNITLQSVADNGSITVAVGNADGGDAYIATMGATVGVWTERSNPKNLNLTTVKWHPDENLFVACGGDSTTDTPYIIYSSDGITWTEVPAYPANAGFYYDLAYVDEVSMIAVGYSRSGGNYTGSVALATVVGGVVTLLDRTPTLWGAEEKCDFATAVEMVNGVAVVAGILAVGGTGYKYADIWPLEYDATTLKYEAVSHARVGYSPDTYANGLNVRNIARLNYQGVLCCEAGDTNTETLFAHSHQWPNVDAL